MNHVTEIGSKIKLQLNYYGQKQRVAICRQLTAQLLLSKTHRKAYLHNKNEEQICGFLILQMLVSKVLTGFQNLH